MRRNKIINVCGLGWTGSTLLFELFGKLEVGLYHDEFNFLRHPKMVTALRDNNSKSFIKVCLNISRACASNIPKNDTLMKSKIFIEIIFLLIISLSSLIISNKILAKLYINMCFLLYAKNKILVVDQLWFPEDLRSELTGIEEKINFEIYHVCVFRRNVDKVFRDREEYFDFLSPQTLREKFFLGIGLQITNSVIHGQTARRLFFERKKIVEGSRLPNLKCLYFEDLVVHTEEVMVDVLEFIDEQNLMSEKFLDILVKHASKSRKNL